MFNPRVTRQNITPLLTNQYSDEILRDQIFSETALSASLSVTDQIDSVSVSLHGIVYGILSLNDAPDSSVVGADNIVSLGINATDQTDIAVFDSGIIISTEIKTPEASDITNFETDVNISFNADAIERGDTAKIKISIPGSEKKKNTQAPIDWYQFYLALIKRKVKLDITERRDGAVFSAEHINIASANIKERGDRLFLISDVKTLCEFNSSENCDSLKNDEEGFRVFVNDLYARYEHEIIIAILNAA